jgi:hypothetical protein
MLTICELQEGRNASWCCPLYQDQFQAKNVIALQKKKGWGTGSTLSYPSAYSLLLEDYFIYNYNLLHAIF